MKTGRPLKVNLRRDGYEAAAEHVSSVVRGRRGNYLVLVEPDGGVRVRPTAEVRDDLDALVQDERFVAVVNGKARIEFIENDLIERMRAMG